MDNAIIIIVSLILLSTIVKNIYLRMLVIFLLTMAVSHQITNDTYTSLYISFIITAIYYLGRSNTLEGFEDGEVDVNGLVKELTSLATKNEDVGKKIGEEKTITEEDINLLDQDDDTPVEGNKYMEASKAQRETFRLINTIKQLDETVNSLAPTLKQGADIIEKFKKLNLISA